MGAIGRAARQAAGDRAIILVAENERTGRETGAATRAKEATTSMRVWNDDLAPQRDVCALTGRARSLLHRLHSEVPQEFISAAKYGYLFQGQPYSWQEAPRGYPAHWRLPPQTVCRISSTITTKSQMPPAGNACTHTKLRPAGTAP